MQSPKPGAGHLAGMCAAPPIAAEVSFDVFCTYRAHAGAKFPAYGCVPKLDIINLQYLDLLVVS